MLLFRALLFCIYLGEVIFNNNQPTEPPDFILGTDEKFMPDLENIKVCSVYAFSLIQCCKLF